MPDIMECVEPADVVNADLAAAGKKRPKAIVLLSGGLDSMLALRLTMEQGVDVTAVKFSSPFCNCNQGGVCFARNAAEELDIPFIEEPKGIEYLKVVRNPKYGHGKGMNPCIDCRIFMLRRTKELMDEMGADFIVTGEVLGQRPMSQHLRAMMLIETEAGLSGKILRPLSARLLPKGVAERKGWVERQDLGAIRGRSRKEQLRMAGEMGVQDHACAAGGCLLTNKEFARKLRDLFEHKKRVTMGDAHLLKVGRHFRWGRNKMIVGRNEAENAALMRLKQVSDYVFEVPGCGSPVTLLQGEKTGEAIRVAASLTARYSDCTSDEVLVKYGKDRPTRGVRVAPISRDDAERMNIAKWVQ